MQNKQFSVVFLGVSIAILLGGLFTRLGAESRFVEPKAAPVVSLQVQQKSAVIPADSTIALWVFFTDKGFTDQSGFEKARASYPHLLTARSLQRRRLRGLIPPEIQLSDIPVNAEYVRQIMSVPGVKKLRTRTRWLDGISVDVSPAAVSQIAQLSFVRKIQIVRSSKYQPPVGDNHQSVMNPGLPKTSDILNYGPSYNQLEQINVIAAHNAGYSGQGILVLMLDTGFDTDHIAVNRNRIVAQYDFINKDSVTKNQPGDPINQDNHGTETFSTLGGAVNRHLYGPAYQCQFVLAKTEIVNKEIQVEEDYYVAGLEWGDSLGADLASSSLGYLDWYTFADLDGKTAVTTIGVNQAIARGMTVVNAAGNENGTKWNHIIAPADAPYVISCGAVDSLGVIAFFSSHGPTADGRIKPEVVARGVDTYCASPAASDAFHHADGTSFSTPLVAGSAALILEAHPDWTPIQVRRALMQTANNTADPNNIYGWGLINAMAAINYTQPGQKQVTIADNYPNPFSMHHSTTIEYTFSDNLLHKNDGNPITIKIYDLRGRLIKTILDNHWLMKVNWDGKNADGAYVSSGIYFYQVQLGDVVDHGKMIFIR